jgi:hypothetical protein
MSTSTLKRKNRLTVFAERRQTYLRSTRCINSALFNEKEDHASTKAISAYKDASKFESDEIIYSLVGFKTKA